MTDERIKKYFMKDIEENTCSYDVRKSPEQKVEDLKIAIANLGYKIEETPEGDIKISE